MGLLVSKETEMIATEEAYIASSEIFDYIALALIDQGIRGIKQFKVIQKDLKEFEVMVVKDEVFIPRSIEYFKSFTFAFF